MPEIAAFDTPEVEFFAKKNACSQQALTDLNCLVPKVGLEPTLCHHNRILSPARLPFRHFGLILNFYFILIKNQLIIITDLTRLEKVNLISH